MEIDIIKWEIGYADGYHLKTNKYKNIPYEIVDYGEDRVPLLEFASCESNALSLLHQRAIEGINTSYGNDRIRLTSRYSIAQKRWCYLIERHGANVWNTDWYDLIDHAKIAVLKYLFEQEKNS